MSPMESNATLLGKTGVTLKDVFANLKVIAFQCVCVFVFFLKKSFH